MLRILFHPVLDAVVAEEVAASEALLRVIDNLQADEAVEYFSLQVGEAFFRISWLVHFVDSFSNINKYL